VKFELDLREKDQRLTIWALLMLAAGEPGDNLVGVSFDESGDGTKQSTSFQTGLPATWLKLDGIPCRGAVSVTYACAPENVRLRVRLNLARTIGGWMLPDQFEAEPWETLEAAPAAVVSFCDHCTARGLSMNYVFKKIAEKGDARAITFPQFNQGLSTLDWVDKSGEDNRAIFSFLDQGMEGSITKQEWTVMRLLAKEIKHSMLDFLEVLQVYFPDPSAAWRFLDPDDSGCVTQEEWDQAVVRINFLGYARAVFLYIDEGDNGFIEEEEWERVVTLHAQQWLHAKDPQEPGRQPEPGPE